MYPLTALEGPDEEGAETAGQYRPRTDRTCAQAARLLRHPHAVELVGDDVHVANEERQDGHERSGQTQGLQPGHEVDGQRCGSQERRSQDT